MKLNNNITACWLTINRACNLKCRWCYAKNAENEQMDFDTIVSLLDFLETMNIRNIIILGGEPTVSSNLVRIVSESKMRGFNSILVTNGIRLSDKEYLLSLIDAGLTTINLSQKAHNKESYIEITRADCYDQFLNAVKNISETGIDFVVSFVLTTESIQYIPHSMRIARSYGAKKFSLGFCYDFEACRLAESNPENPYRLWAEFSKRYEEINEESAGKFVLQMGLPLCVADKELIELMNERSQILSVCQLLRRSGLIFDTDFSVIPCNAMFNYKLGKYGVSFSDKESFEQFWNSKEIIDFYNKLKAAPSIECIKCDSWMHCGGGCISNWFNYQFADLKELKKEVSSNG